MDRLERVISEIELQLRDADDNICDLEHERAELVAQGATRHALDEQDAAINRDHRDREALLRMLDACAAVNHAINDEME